MSRNMFIYLAFSRLYCTNKLPYHSSISVDISVYLLYTVYLILFSMSAKDKLRRVKSSCSIGKIQCSGPSPETLDPEFDKSTYGRLKRSKSVLRGKPQYSKIVRHAKSHDALIHLNNQEAEQRPSEWKPFRETSRTDGDCGLDAADMPRQLEHSGNGILHDHDKPHSLSHSIKNGLKRLLRISKPPRAHGMSIPQPSWDSNNVHSAEHTTGIDCPVDGGETHHSGLYDPAYLNDRQSTIHSAKSSESVSASNSRVTSWGDSTAASTVETSVTSCADSAAPNAVTTRDACNRLSMARDHGNIGGYYSQITPSDSSSYFSRVRPGADESNRPYDSRRNSPALMETAESENEGNPDKGVVAGACSIYSHRSGRSTSRIPSDESTYFPESFSTAEANTPTVRRQLSRMSMLYREDDVPGPYQHGSGTEGHEPVSPGTRSRHSLARRNSNCPCPCGRSARKPFIRGEVANNDAKAVVELERSNERQVSPSAYSRTTSCSTPIDHVIADLLILREEQRTVPTFDCQRYPYNFPRKAAYLSPSATICSLPNHDWQQWATPQIKDTEQVTRTRREHHVEEAQTKGDEEDTTRPEENENSSKGLNKKSSVISAKTNFSRPFNRSPSTHTVVSPIRPQAASRSFIPVRTTGVGPAYATESPKRYCPRPPPVAGDAKPISFIPVRTTGVGSTVSSFCSPASPIRARSDKTSQ